MPRFSPDQLHQIGCELFQAVGCSERDTKCVVDHLVESNLFGHDSHGAIVYSLYIDAIREGRFDPRGRPQIVEQTACTAVVDGNGALGQVGGTMATELAIAKARESGIGSVALRDTSHVGRAGAYALSAAREAMLGLVFVNSGRMGCQVAPFGGIDGKLSTNPLAFSAPRRAGDPVLLDITTSAVAEGKIRVARNEGRPVPEGWLIDHEGRPTSDPGDYFSDPPGAILPLGGPLGYKGYGLSFLVELLGGALTGQGCAAGERKLVSNGMLVVAIRIEHFVPRERYETDLESLIEHVRSSRLAPGADEVLLPGELEFRTAERRRREGIEIDETTWDSIKTAARQLRLNPERWESKGAE